MLSSAVSTAVSTAAAAKRNRIIDPRIIVASATLTAAGLRRQLGDPPRAIYHPEYKYYAEGKVRVTSFCVRQRAQ